MVDKLFNTIIPQLEERLETKFEVEAGAREAYAPSMVEYLKKREEFVQHLRRRKSLAEDDVIEGILATVTPEYLHQTDSKLYCARSELADVNSALHHLADDLKTFDEKSKQSLRKSFGGTFYHEYYINHVDAFQRYMEAKKERRLSSTC